MPQTPPSSRKRALEKISSVDREMNSDHGRLVIVVGLTGVGKSTVLERVRASRPDLRLLPNRREITDRIIVPEVQRREDQPVGHVTDRLERFRLTAAYRDHHPGGMAHALQRWLAELGATEIYPAKDVLVFDNLRGLDEVRAADDAFPGAAFLVLDASPLTRLARLVGRRDPFDRVATPTIEADEAPGELAERLREIAGATSVFDPEEVGMLAMNNALDADDLIRAVRIIVGEQRNYDSGAARRWLESHLPARRYLIVDTDVLGPLEVAERVLAWLDERGGS